MNTQTEQLFSEVKHWNNGDGFITIDAWKTADDNEEGQVVAVVTEATGDVFFVVPEARLCSLVEEEINAVKEELVANKVELNEDSINELCKDYADMSNNLSERIDGMIMDFFNKVDTDYIELDLYKEEFGSENTTIRDIEDETIVEVSAIELQRNNVLLWHMGANNLSTSLYLANLTITDKYGVLMIVNELLNNPSLIH